MPRKPKGPTPEQVKAAADRAEASAAAAPNLGGRPSKYQPEFATQAQKLCALGATDEDLADFFSVTIRSVVNWKSKYPEFGEALKFGKGIPDDKVERSLYQRAVGYTYDTVKLFHHQGRVIREEIREHCPPDTTAAIFWLKNRRPEEWRDKHDHSHSGNLTVELVKFANDSNS